MHLVEVELNKPRSPLDISSIEKYNDVVGYLSLKENRRKYHSNHKELEHTASVLKFTIEKEAKKLESEILDYVLFSTFVSGIDHIIINKRHLMRLPACSTSEMKGDGVAFCNMISTLIPGVSVDWRGVTCSLNFRDLYFKQYPVCSFYKEMLSNDTEHLGIYSIHSITSSKVVFKATTKRVEMYENMFDRGWIISPGIPPSPLRETMHQAISDAKEALDACKLMRNGSSYKKKVLKSLVTFHKNYRWRGSETFKTELYNQLPGKK